MSRRDAEPSLKDQIRGLAVVPETEHAVGWNAALDEVLRVVDHHFAKIAPATTAALADLRASGRKTGGEAPYGFEADGTGKLRPKASEQRVIAEARKRRGAGHSLRQVASALAERGMRNREGRTFDATAIRRMTAVGDMIDAIEQKKAQRSGADTRDARRPRAPRR